MKDRRYQLRDQLDHRLTSAELDGVPVEYAMADLIKLTPASGLITSLAVA